MEKAKEIGGLWTVVNLKTRKMLTPPVPPVLAWAMHFDAKRHGVPVALFVMSPRAGHA